MMIKGDDLEISGSDHLISRNRGFSRRTYLKVGQMVFSVLSLLNLRYWSDSGGNYQAVETWEQGQGGKGNWETSV